LGTWGNSQVGHAYRVAHEGSPDCRCRCRSRDNIFRGREDTEARSCAQIEEVEKAYVRQHYRNDEKGRRAGDPEPRSDGDWAADCTQISEMVDRDVGEGPYRHSHLSSQESEEEGAECADLDHRLRSSPWAGDALPNSHPGVEADPRGFQTTISREY
jgi:hypothetical protein